MLEEAHRSMTQAAARDVLFAEVLQELPPGG